jgi:DNA polymerase-3 subunit gamma/tau
MPPDDPQSARQDGFDLGGPPEAGKHYRVLARKYRPSSFDDLIGQDAMVRTVSNAFETGRIPQAWILTGVRGVGKTTTARILARALNYELPDGSVKGPTIHMKVPGVHCQAIMESRHMDVLEMDAASHTGVDDVRQINDSVRYAPASARYKVYIIDEVHMLSTAAFNAFLKTLEEPPEHAKFVFATTEIRKVPVTVLSRCQRFDLRRVEADVLMGHLASIAAKENVEVEPEALGVIARAAEGSVRDSLSLFDQAIAHAAGRVRADAVRQMLGLADRTRVIDLFDSLARGDIASAFREFREQYDTGADPIVVLSDLAEFVNFVTRVKIVPATADNVAFGETERLRGRDFAAKISMRVLSRMWQMLLKGITEVQAATRPAAAAEMVLVRIAYVADMPTPDEAIRMLEQNGGTSAAAAGNAAPRSAPASTMSAVQSSPARAPAASRANTEASVRPQMIAPSPDLQSAAVLRIASFPELVALAGDKRDLLT